MFEDTVHRLVEIMSTPIVVSGLPPPAKTAWERALDRRDRLVPAEFRRRVDVERQARELARIDEAW
jgi:hypothetical protein